MSMFILYSYLHVYIYICTRPCHPPPWDGSHIRPLYEIFSLPPLWCGGGVVWYVGYVWCVWSVWYGMSGKDGVFGMYGRYAMYGMNGCYCMDGKYGM